MKKLLFTLFVYAIVVIISSCGGNKTQDDHSGVHTHEDGTVHDGDHEEAVEQESFEVDADAEEEHDHSGTHTHEDGTVHEDSAHEADVATEEADDHDHDHEGDHEHQH